APLHRRRVQAARDGARPRMTGMRDDSSSSAREQTWRRYLRFWGTRVTADVDDELRFHIDMLVDRYRADGMSDVDARAAAAARLGDMARHTNVCVGIATRRERRVTRALTLDA